MPFAFLRSPAMIKIPPRETRPMSRTGRVKFWDDSGYPPFGSNENSSALAFENMVTRAEKAPRAASEVIIKMLEVLPSGTIAILHDII